MVVCAEVRPPPSTRMVVGRVEASRRRRCEGIRISGGENAWLSVGMPRGLWNG